METGIQGKIALVTGAARGMGKAIALALAKEGADIVVNDINLEGATTTSEEVKKIGVNSMVVQADVAKEAEVQKMVDQIVDSWGSIDILVNNAGVAAFLLVEDIEKSEWDRVLDINLGGTFNCSRAVIPIMKKRGGGKIVNMGSFAGKRMSMDAGAHYSASKAGVLSLTRQLAYEVAPFKINVNAVCPGHVLTDIVMEIDPKIREGWT